MKNVTLAIPELLLEKSRDFAKTHGTTLNQMIRDLLSKHLNSTNDSRLDQIKFVQKELQLKTKDYKFDREEIYER